MYYIYDQTEVVQYFSNSLLKRKLAACEHSRCIFIVHLAKSPNHGRNKQKKKNLTPHVKTTNWFARLARHEPVAFSSSGHSASHSPCPQRGHSASRPPGPATIFLPPPRPTRRRALPAHRIVLPRLIHQVEPTPPAADWARSPVAPFPIPLSGFRPARPHSSCWAGRGWMDGAMGTLALTPASGPDRAESARRRSHAGWAGVILISGAAPAYPLHTSTPYPTLWGGSCDLDDAGG